MPASAPSSSKAREGGPGAGSLKPATTLARKRHVYGYDIGSSSDRDPIKHRTLVSSKRWDVALERISSRHKPFFQAIFGWLADINGMSEEEATLALAAFIRVRRDAAPGAALTLVPSTFDIAPRLDELIAPPLEELHSRLPHVFAEALRGIRAREATIETWAAISQRWA
jgi:hypothetical protein